MAIKICTYPRTSLKKVIVSSQEQEVTTDEVKTGIEVNVMRSWSKLSSRWWKRCNISEPYSCSSKSRKQNTEFMSLNYIITVVRLDKMIKYGIQETAEKALDMDI